MSLEEAINSGDFGTYKSLKGLRPRIGHYVYIRFHNKGNEGIADWFLSKIRPGDVSYYEVVNVAISDDAYMLVRLLKIISSYLMDELRSKGVRLPTSEQVTDVLESHGIPTLLVSAEDYAMLVETLGRVPNQETLDEAIRAGDVSAALTLVRVGLVPSENSLLEAVNNDEMISSILEEYELLGVKLRLPKAL